ncbi:hypothetical protein [Nonomuraea cavernae]|uniref:Uncharacterized protein n=1 Tax=Nonomuraea cavernae TaxID=2045107 RepID=A0A918DGY9_9ACTN|nr:hypothetical protein [Nonomuraea cavernae]MCA2185158.1 hypothetical protein [Nonomuraea cavernae]GGO65587.1 hypothetical protein GCM10012289_17630 [Nonomuraea cavernae]
MTGSASLEGFAHAPGGSPEDLHEIRLPGTGRHPDRRPPGARGVFSWLPAVLTLGFVAVVLWFYGVSVGDMAAFGAYVVLCLAGPGLLLVRALYGDRRTLAEELALGVALGYAIEVLVYIIVRALDLPLLVVAWPIAVYVAFLASPRLRRHWKGGARPAAPIWWSWSLAAIVCYLVAWSARAYYSFGPLSWPALAGYPDDAPFHLALIGELKQHMPPMTPMVAGEPLSYHWFVYAHYAAASWISGVEPLVLLFRLGMLPVLAAFVVLVALLGRQVMESWRGALIATCATVLLGAPLLYLGSSGVFTFGGMHDAAWGSPTFAFGALLFVPVVLLVNDLLRLGRWGGGVWLLLAIFLVVVMGAKATHLPMLTVGLLAVIAVKVVRRRRPPWAAVVTLAMTAGCLFFAQYVLYGGQRQGTIVAPLSYLRTVWQDLTGLPIESVPPLASLLGVLTIYLLSWAVTWCPVLGLLSRPRSLLRADVVLMLGISAAGLGAILVLDHPGRSQLYFLWGTYPYLAIIAVHGLIVILRRGRVSRRATLCAVGAGVVCAYAIPVLCGVRTPLDPGQADSVLYRPHVALAVVVALAVLVLVVLKPGRRGWALLLTALAAIGLPAAHHARVLSFAYGGGGQAASAEPGVAVPQGALAAARWLRANSAEDTLVATNVHCRWGFENPCDTRQFWMSALTERRFLIEGWAFTSTNADRWQPGLPVMSLPFWDRARFEANEAAFAAPSTGAVQRLRERYGVGWLFVDGTRPGVSPDLADFARLRFRSGDFAVYQTDR